MTSQYLPLAAEVRGIHDIHDYNKIRKAATINPLAPVECSSNFENIILILSIQNYSLLT